MDPTPIYADTFYDFDAPYNMVPIQDNIFNDFDAPYSMVPIQDNIFNDFDAEYNIVPTQNIIFDAEYNIVPTQEKIFVDFDTSCNMIPVQENSFHDFEERIENPPPAANPFELLKMYGTKKKRMHVKEKVTDQTVSVLSHNTSSATSIMKLVRSRLLELKSENLDVFSVLSETHHGLINCEEEIDLAMALQVSAEHVSEKRFASGSELLRKCHHLASKTGTPLQRIVYYFSQALQQKLDQEMGFITSDRIAAESKKQIDVVQTINALQPAWISCQQKFSASVVCQYTSIQTILDNVVTAKRVHLIDLRIKTGSHLTVLIQALADRYECPIELLKITAVGTSNELMEKTGKSLSDFAQTMNVPFSFEIVLSDLKKINKEMFQLEDDETIAIYSSFCLWTVLAWPNELENLISMVKELNPCLMVINEVDANLNSTDFMERFTETLFHTSAIFDGLLLNFENEPSRKLIEEDIYGGRITNIITRDGTERAYRCENASFWRALFKRCGFVEQELSSSALSQAKLLLDKSLNGLYIEIDGKCLSVGWNGTPLEFVSTWKLL